MMMKYVFLGCFIIHSIVSFSQVDDKSYKGFDELNSGYLSYSFTNEDRFSFTFIPMDYEGNITGDKYESKGKYKIVNDTLFTTKGRRKLKQRGFYNTFLFTKDSLLIDAQLGYDLIQYNQEDSLSIYSSQSGKNNFPYIETKDSVFQNNVLKVIQEIFEDTSIVSFFDSHRDSVIVIQNFFELNNHNAQPFYSGSKKIMFRDTVADVRISKLYIHPIEKDKYIEIVFSMIGYESDRYYKGVLKILVNYSITKDEFLLNSKVAWYDYDLPSQNNKK